MLIEHTIKNRNYEPILLSDIIPKILDEYKYDSTNFEIRYSTAEKNIVLRPFESYTFFIDIAPKDNVYEFKGRIYNDLTIVNDSIKYGTFFYSFPIDVEIKRKFIGVELYEDLELITVSDKKDIIFEFYSEKSNIQKKIKDLYNKLGIDEPKIVSAKIYFNIDYPQEVCDKCPEYDYIKPKDAPDSIKKLVDIEKNINIKNNESIFSVKIKHNYLQAINEYVNSHNNSVNDINKFLPLLYRFQVVYSLLIDLTPNIKDKNRKSYYNLKIYTAKFFKVESDVETEESKSVKIIKNLGKKGTLIYLLPETKKIYTINSNEIIKFNLKQFYGDEDITDYTVSNISVVNGQIDAEYLNSTFKDYIKNINNQFINIPIDVTANDFGIIEISLTLSNGDENITLTSSAEILYPTYDEPYLIIETKDFEENIYYYNELNNGIISYKNLFPYDATITNLEIYAIYKNDDYLKQLKAPISDGINIVNNDILIDAKYDTNNNTYNVHNWGKIKKVSSVNTNLIIDKISTGDLRIYSIFIKKLLDRIEEENFVQKKEKNLYVIKIKYIINDVEKEYYKFVNLNIRDVSIDYSFLTEGPYILKPEIFSTLKLHLIPEGIAITDYDVVGDVLKSEVFIKKDDFPISGNRVINVNIKPIEEKFYNFKLRLKTNSLTIPYIDIPISFISTKFDVDEAFKFDDKSFYVLNNVYHISLKYLQTKIKKVKIIYKGEIPLTIYSANISNNGIQGKILNNIFPIDVNKGDEIELSIEFRGVDFGNYMNYIELQTDYGIAILPISAFINTKDVDSYVIMKNTSGLKFKSTTASYSIDYIKLINFGDDYSRLNLQKLGAQQNNFFIAKKPYVEGRNIADIEVAYAPLNTGIHTSQLDIELLDELNTFIIYRNNQTQITKIQNAHIIAKLLGVAISENAVPYFRRNIIDFGSMSFENIKNKIYSHRFDVIEIENLGAQPFRILNIQKTIKDSPFEVLVDKYPIKIFKFFQLPIYVNINKINGPGEYSDILIFTIEDNLKNVYTYKIPLNLKVVVDEEIFVDFNVDEINFGYAEIDSIKEEFIYIKNFSTTAKEISVEYQGDPEISTYNYKINLQPNQKQKVPLYFLPKGIGTFSGKLILKVGDYYTKEANIIGMGVDFKSPLINMKNEINEFLKKSKKQI